jgi:hypothetical protein
MRSKNRKVDVGGKDVLEWDTTFVGGGSREGITTAGGWARQGG